MKKEPVKILENRVEMRDGTERLKKILYVAMHGTPEEKEEMVERIHREDAEAGAQMLKTAIEKKLISQEEWENWQTEYGITFIGAATFLAPLLQKLNEKKKKKEEIFLVTGEKEALYRMRHVVKEKFGFNVLTMAEANEKILAEKEKEKNKEMKRLLKVAKSQVSGKK
jgi:hypothetical protein